MLGDLGALFSTTTLQGLSENSSAVFSAAAALACTLGLDEMGWSSPAEKPKKISIPPKKVKPVNMIKNMWESLGFCQRFGFSSMDSMPQIR